jgi:RimJ/RimL family protein N-acetyltransferase
VPAYDDVQIRDVEAADVAVFFAHQQDPEAARMAAWTPWEREQFGIQWAAMRADPTIEAQTIVVNGEIAGNITCWPREGGYEVGYWLGRAHWGRGVATTALALALCRISVRPLYAHAAAHNAPSLRVLNKCGFLRQPEYDRVTVGDLGEVTLLAHVLET